MRSPTCLRPRVGDRRAQGSIRPTLARRGEPGADTYGSGPGNLNPREAAPRECSVRRHRCRARPPKAGKPLPFPLRVAAIDVGSNAFRFIAAEFSDPNHYVELASERVRSASVTRRSSPANSRLPPSTGRSRGSGASGKKSIGWGIEHVRGRRHERGSREPQRLRSGPPRRGGSGNPARPHLGNG